MADREGWSLKKLPVQGVDILLPSDGLIFPAIDAAPDERAPRFVPFVSDRRTEPCRPPVLAVSALQTLLECPLRYWLQRRAGLRELPLGLATPADWGSLTHSFWERVWRRFDRERNPFLELAEGEWQTLTAASAEYEAFRKKEQIICLGGATSDKG